MAPYAPVGTVVSCELATDWVADQSDTQTDAFAADVSEAVRSVGRDVQLQHRVVPVARDRVDGQAPIGQLAGDLVGLGVARDQRTDPVQGYQHGLVA